jgi:Leucine-rich repeat (LRR) protein
VGCVGNQTNSHLAHGGPHIVTLSQLNANTNDNVWEEFFTQRGAGTFWEILLKRSETMFFNLYDLKDSRLIQQDVTQQVNEVTSGIIRYLSCKNVQINALAIKSKKDSNKKLTYLSDEIGALTSLTLLYLNYNDLQEIPDVIGKLINLSILDISYNSLKEIPHELSHLKKLTSLNLSNNQLEKLPTSMLPLLYNIPNIGINRLYLNNNPWLNVASGNLIEINIGDDIMLEQLKEEARKQLPASLKVLALKHIQNLIHNNIQLQQFVDNNLSFLDDFSTKEARENVLKQAGEWQDGKSIILLQELSSIEIPFYIQNVRPLLNSEDVDFLFAALTLSLATNPENKFYKVLD